ncbi:hypothetical protein FQA39_LY18306 [Lamprigera yunnana]|nr:hypothetical protein FQA39_LY18306 [Lamprigera yunnana]
MIFLLLIIALVFDLGNFALISLTNQEDCVRRCIKNIIDAYVDDVRTVLSIHGDFTRGNFLPHPMQIPIINIDVNQKVYNFNYQPSRELVIIDPVNYNFDEIRRLGFWNVADFSKRKFVFLFSNSASSYVQGLSHYLWKVDIIDVIFLVYDSKSRHRYTEVLVGNPHHPSNKCGRVVANLSSLSCDTIKKTRKHKFFRNYSKCKLIYLYEVLFPQANNDLFYITDFVLSEISGTLNLSLYNKHKKSATTYNDNYLWLENMRSCDNKTRFCGNEFIRINGVFTVPSPKQLGTIEVFKLIFKWNTWVLILLTFIITCLVWWAISACIQPTTFSSTVFDMYSIILRGAINRVPQCFSLRCLFLSYVIYSIHIQTGFTCNLVPLLTVPQYSSIKTLEELADSDLPILIPCSSADILYRMSHEGNKIFEKIKNKFHVLSDDEWKASHINLQLLENSSIMTATMTISRMVEALQRKVYFIHDETLIGSELWTFETKPGSFLLQDVNKVISSLRESGLLDYQRLIYKRKQKDYIKYYEEPHSTENVVLDMKHVFPIFLFWGAGMVIATVAFVLEHFTYYIKNSQINEASTSQNNYSEDVLLVSSPHQTAVATRMKKNADDVVFQQTLETLGALNEKLLNEQRGNKENEFGNFVAMELSGIRDVKQNRKLLK